MEMTSEEQLNFFESLLSKGGNNSSHQSDPDDSKPAAKATKLSPMRSLTKSADMVSVKGSEKKKRKHDTVSESRRTSIRGESKVDEMMRETRERIRQKQIVKKASEVRKPASKGTLVIDVDTEESCSSVKVKKLRLINEAKMESREERMVNGPAEAAVPRSEDSDVEGVELLKDYSSEAKTEILQESTEMVIEREEAVNPLEEDIHELEEDLPRSEESD